MEAGRITGVITADGRIEADAVVVALGSFSPLLVRPHGIRLPVYPVKGYSLTIPITDASRAPESTVMDETYKVALTRLGDRIRVGGTAEIAGFDLSLRPSRRGALDYHRPLLPVPGQALRSWLRLRGEAWVEDPSNADTAYTRNRIRSQLLPALATVFPAFRTTLARSAQHVAQAQRLLDEVAAADLLACGVPPRLAALQALSPARQGNALRHWLAHAHASVPSAAQLAELQSQIDACRTRGHAIRLKVGRGFVTRHGDALQWQPVSQPPEASG